MDMHWATVSQEVVQRAIELTPRVMIGLVLFSLFWLLSLAIGVAIKRWERQASPKTQPVVLLLYYTAKVGLLLFGGITALGSMGVNVSALVAGLGITGFAMTFATKDTLSNLVAGIIILLFQPFRIGQHIEVNKQKGQVKDIDLRYTTLKTETGLCLVPNSSFLTAVVQVLD